MESTSAAPIPEGAPLPPYLPNYDLFVTEDGKAVDSLYSERQHQLLTEVLGISWPKTINPRRYVATDVGIYFAEDQPAPVPDVFISLGVDPPANAHIKKHRSYFVWVVGKLPELVLEVVSNTEGGELTTKFQDYEKQRILYYVVWDPMKFLSETAIQCFRWNEGKYAPCEPWFPVLQLGVTTWTGAYHQMTDTWLRWCDQQGKVLANAEEAVQQASGRAEQEKTRAEKLAAKLRELGIDPDQLS